MKNILVIILVIMSFIGIAQESKLSEIISSQIERDEYRKQYSWITDTPLKLARTSSLKNVTPKFEGVSFNLNDNITLISEYVNGNIVTYPTFGKYKIITEKILEGLLIWLHFFFLFTLTLRPIQ